MKIYVFSFVASSHFALVVVLFACMYICVCLFSGCSMVIFFYLLSLSLVRSHVQYMRLISFLHSLAHDRKLRAYVDGIRHSQSCVVKGFPQRIV